MSIKIKLPQQDNVIDIDDNSAVLEDITKSGFYIYKFKYFIDPAHWQFSQKGSKPSLVILNLFNLNSKTSKVSIFNSGVDLFAANIMQATSKQKDMISQQEKENIIFTYNSDFTKKIPNNMTQDIVNKTSLTSNTKLVLTKKITTVTTKVSDIKDKNQSLPKLDVNRAVNKKDNLVTIEQHKIKSTKESLLIKNKIDPASIFGLRTNTIVSANSSLGGLCLNTKTIGKTDIKTKQISANRNIADKKNNAEKVRISNKNDKSTPVVHGHLNKLSMISKEEKEKIEYCQKNAGMLSVTDTTSVNDMSGRSSVPIVVYKESHLLEIEEVVHIPASLLGTKDFKLTFELRNKLGSLVQKIEKFVPHEQNIFNKHIPALAPNISIQNSVKPGKTRIELKQNDEDATSIQLYRRTINLDEMSNDATYALIKTIQLKKDETPIIIEDAFSNVNPTIYRAISVSNYGIQCGEFASIVVDSDKSKVVKTSTISHRQTFLSFHYKFVDNKIELTIENIPSGAITVQVKKRNLSLFEQAFSPVTNRILLKNGRENSTVVNDSNLKDSMIYEYNATLVYADGHEVISSNTLIVEYQKVETNIVNLKLTPPATLFTDNSIDVEFHIEKEIIKTDTDNIKSLLDAQGLLEEYQSDIILNKEKLQSLFFIRIVRTNINTGAEEDFGIINADLFKESAYANVKNVKPVEAGYKYIYAIYAHARAPNTLLENIETSVTTRGLTHTYKASKWRHPTTLKHGSLVTEQSLKKNSAKTQFSLGNIVDIQYLELDLSDSKPIIIDAESAIIGQKSNVVKWSINGMASKIDHFIITLTISGNKTVVGKCHNVTKSSSFQFVDILDNHESGELVYGITPIYYDYSSGQEHSTNALLI